MNQIAVIRIRGKSGVNQDISDTMDMLKLLNKNHCSIYPATPAVVGMIQKIKDYATWGEIDKETFLLLLRERGRTAGNVRLTDDYVKKNTGLNITDFVNALYDGKKSLKDIPGLKLYFRLKPPVQGFERGGIKVPFSMGGTLGYRKDDINRLLKRMI
jgi:large subunit ribosomal protein L30